VLEHPVVHDAYVQMREIRFGALFQDLFGMASKSAGSRTSKGTNCDSIPHPQLVPYANPAELGLDRIRKVLELSRRPTVATIGLAAVMVVMPPVAFSRCLEECPVHALQQRLLTLSLESPIDLIRSVRYRYP
jgi:hypothetical protein